MTPVVKLDDHRPKPKPKKLEGQRFFCMACQSDQFKVMADGTIFCADCTSRIKDLFARVIA